MLDRVEADHTDPRVELNVSAHTHRAMGDAAFQRPLAARVNVLAREVAFGRGGFPDRFRNGALFNAAAVEDTGLVEMDMRFDEAGDDQAARSTQFGRIYLKPR